jgi:DNA-directed RNA polymerase alpha subunit
MFIQTEESNRFLDASILDTLKLSTRAKNVLKNYRISTVRDLVDIVGSHDNWLTKLQNCDKVTRNEIVAAMESIGFKYVLME